MLLTIKNDYQLVVTYLNIICSDFETNQEDMKIWNVFKNIGL